ncbi:MAG: diacylglycerol kinase family protein [Planctomycetota bacterium]
MRITLLANKRSGRGKAFRLADELDSILASRGHSINRPTLDGDLDLASAAGGSDRLIIVGGDGTVHHSCGAAAELGVPVYHLATGTENLFARYFSMPRDPEPAADAIEQDHPPIEIDLGSANGVPFALMCSLGIDASVIHRVENVRGGKGGHAMYVLPSIAEGLRPRIACLNITPNRNPPAQPFEFSDTAVVSNIPAYALRMDPCHGAAIDDRQLDLALLDSTTSIGTAFDFVRCKLRSKRIRRLRAPSFEIETRSDAPPSHIQIDGERPQAESPLPRTLEAGERLSLGVWPTKMMVHARPELAG